MGNFAGIAPLQPHPPTAVHDAAPLVQVVRHSAPTDKISACGEVTSSATHASRPTLDPPLPEYEILASIDRAHQRAGTSLKRQCQNLDRTYAEIDEITKKNMATLHKAAEESQKSGVWSLLKQIGACILGAISVVLGFALGASGAGTLIGGALIASGALMITNLILSEAGGWDWVAEKISNGNEELAKKLRWIFPGVIGIIAAGAGIFGSVHALTTLGSSFELGKQILVIATSAANFAQGVATIGEGLHNAKNLRLQSDLTGFQKQLFTQREKAKKALSGMNNIMDTQNKVCEQAAHIINLSTDYTSYITA